MQICNTLLKAFSRYGQIGSKITQEEKEKKLPLVAKELNLNARTDEPLPSWAIKILKSKLIKYPDKLYLIALHEEEIYNFRNNEVPMRAEVPNIRTLLKRLK